MDSLLSTYGVIFTEFDSNDRGDADSIDIRIILYLQIYKERYTFQEKEMANFD